MVVSPSTTL
ncbi:hypothetical protein D031_4514A, partial [Vibrio parahaemolyticus VP-48]